MDEKKYLHKRIRECQRKLNLAGLLDKSVLFMAGGGVAAMLAEAVSLFYPFYYVHVWAVGFAAAGLAVGILFSIIKRSDMKTAAHRLDGFGLKERVLTAYENMEEDSELARLQRSDAARHLKEAEPRLHISVLPDKRHLLALGLSVICACTLAFIPSQARDLAKEKHSIEQQAKEKEEELEKLVQKLDKIDTSGMTEEQKAQLQELMESMELSREELRKAESKEALAAAEQKLEYKYEQAAQNLSELAGLVGDPSKAGIASAQELAKAAAGDGSQNASGVGVADGQSGDGDGNGSESGDGNGNGDGSGDGNGDGDGDGNGSGNGDGDGDGNGSGNGNGSGDGNGSGNGNGSGRGTGSGGDTHDYVSVPNAAGNDESVTGEKNGSENSDYYRAQNGLAWEGDHVSLDSVIGNYTQDAYEGIASGKYPDGMENVIKEYFKNLN